MFKLGNPSKLRHGHARRGQQSPENQCWLAIKNRCLNPTHKKFKYYGGRGIAVCDRWKDSFENFLADVGYRPTPQHSIDRFPNRHGNYEPGNVRWATRQQQAENRDCARIVTINGEPISLAALCRQKNLKMNIVRNRIDRGWPLEKALTPPLFQVVRKRRTSQPNAK